MSIEKEKFNSLFCARLTEERKRAGISQATAAEKCEVSREIWGKYERGLTTPGCDVLFLFSQAGADVQYIFTGIRSVNSNDDKGAALSRDEEVLVDKYRRLDPSDRSRAQEIIGVLAPASVTGVKAKKR